MAREIEVVGVRSNTDNLSERAVHDSLVRLLDHIAEQGGDILKYLVPHDTGLLAAHAGHHKAVDEGEYIEAHVGVPPIFKPDSPSPGSMLYPIYVDKGTGIYGEHKSPIYAYRAQYMKLPPKGSYPIYQYSVKGQKPQNYMVKTYALLATSLRIQGEIWKAELKARLKTN